MIFALLLLHLVVGVVIVGVGDRWGRRAFLVAAIVPVVMLIWLSTQLPDVLDGKPVTQDIEWIPQLGLELGLRLDALGAVMILLVSGIGLLVCVYAYGYFTADNPGTARLAGLLTLFAGAMAGVVLSDHLLALFVFWELTSVTSYLLIGNSDRNPRARDAALMAILITGAGGLAMLAGLIMVGQSAGTYRLSELATADLSGTQVAVGAVLILVGAFTKSAQLPFAGWLPGAMVAPTPISTYLHAATMVKAGVYLVARLSPSMADVGIWRPLILVVASATMLVGGWRALRQFDLKLLLAHGTVSQLGFMMLVFGMGAYDLAQAGIVLLIAHGAFKAALFMVVGIIDHQAGTRDIRLLTGWGPGWRGVTIIGVIAAASMAGLPPLIGFIAKEKALDAGLHGEFGGAGLLVAVIVVGSVLTFAYSARFVLGIMGITGRAVQARGEAPDYDGDPSAAPAPAIAFVTPAIVLAVATVLFGIAPMIIDELVRAATIALDATAKPKTVKLWAGFNTALLLSVVIIAAGVVLTVYRRPVAQFQRRVHTWIEPVPDAERVFWATVTGTSALAKRTTRVVQNGSLPIYLLVILGVAALGPTIPAISALDSVPEFTSRWVHIPIAIVIVMAAGGASVARSRIAAALMLGAVGFAMAVLYDVEGAPDLALTQFAIETLATVLFVLVLRFLPRRIDDSNVAIFGPLRLMVSVAVGAAVFVLALVAGAARSDVAAPQISDEMLERSVPDAKGANVVNVILVDFRGLDTLGEITVLLVAGLGVVALARATRRHRSGSVEMLMERLPLLDLFSRLLFGSILVLAIYFLFSGHNQPGGGFVGGLTAGSAISLRYLAGGAAVDRARRGVGAGGRHGIDADAAGRVDPRARRLGGRPPGDRRGQDHLGPALRHRGVPRRRRARAHGLRGLRRRGCDPRRGGGVMTILLALVTAVLFACGTWLLMQRRLSRIIVGIGLLGHGANMLLITSGPSGRAPIIDGSNAEYADPLPQAFALTAVVITFGVTAFLLALGFRSWQLTRDDRVEDDVEDRIIARRRSDGAEGDVEEDAEFPENTFGPDDDDDEESEVPA